MQEDLQKWYAYGVRNAIIRPVENSSESRVLKVNETMLIDSSYNPAFDDSDDEDLDISITHNTTVSVKK